MVAVLKGAHQVTLVENSNAKGKHKPRDLRICSLEHAGLTKARPLVRSPLTIVGAMERRTMFIINLFGLLVVAAVALPFSSIHELEFASILTQRAQFATSRIATATIWQTIIATRPSRAWPLSLNLRPEAILSPAIRNLQFHFLYLLI